MSLNRVTLVKKEKINPPLKKIKRIEELKKIQKKEKKKKIVKKKKKKIIKKLEKRIVEKKEVKNLDNIISKKSFNKKNIEKKIIDKKIKKVVDNNFINREKKVEDYKTNFIKNNLHLIQKHISNNIKYSRIAKKLKIEGRVILKFSLSKNGTISNIRTLSGHKLLIKSTIKALHKASSYFPKVNQDITITIPIKYKLI